MIKSAKRPQHSASYGPAQMGMYWEISVHGQSSWEPGVLLSLDGAHTRMERARAKSSHKRDSLHPVHRKSLAHPNIAHLFLHLLLAPPISQMLYCIMAPFFWLASTGAEKKCLEDVCVPFLGPRHGIANGGASAKGNRQQASGRQEPARRPFGSARKGCSSEHQHERAWFRLCRRSFGVLLASPRFILPYYCISIYIYIRIHGQTWGCDKRGERGWEPGINCEISCSHHLITARTVRWDYVRDVMGGEEARLVLRRRICTRGAGFISWPYRSRCGASTTNWVDILIICTHFGYLSRQGIPRLCQMRNRRWPKWCGTALGWMLVRSFLRPRENPSLERQPRRG